MRVTLFSGFDTKLNPYILLFKKSLEDEGIRVELEREFCLGWLLSKGRHTDCIHLHWISFVFNIYKEKVRSGSIRFLLKNRILKIFLEAIGLFDFFAALAIAKLQGKRIICTVHDLEHFGESFDRHSLRGVMFIRMAHYIAFLLSHSIHVHNHYTRRMIQTRYREKCNIMVIPHGNYIGYYPNQISKYEARRHLDLPDDAFVYLFLGLLRPHKGLENLFEAFVQMEDHHARLLVAGKVFGDISYKSKLSELVKNNPHIKLIAEFIPDEDIQLYMNACDVIVLPYKHITTSGAAALALSFGRPVIAPAITSFPEVITPETGILYNKLESSGLVSALRQAKTNSWSEVGILNYAQQYDWSKFAPQLITLYRRRSGKKRHVCKGSAQR